jgi:hypothetical protein
MDKDGDLDLFVSRYIEFSYDEHALRLSDGHRGYIGPLHYPVTPDAMYRNEGNGRFIDVSEKSGIARHSSSGMGITCTDYDDDGDTDIYVANDLEGNFLWTNDGKGKFEDTALFSGVAYDFYGEAHGSMGAGAGDYNNDGLFDLYVTSYQRESATLYRNMGETGFEDASRRTGAGAGTVRNVTWGNAFADFDNDGDRDIFIACGHLEDRIEHYDDSSTYLQRNVLLMNTGDGRFADVSQRCGDGMKAMLCSRGMGVDDLDNDGDPDVVILNSRAAPTILRNDSPRKGHWLGVRLKGVKTNRDGVGAKVTVVAGDLTLIDEVHSGRSYQSHFGTRLHFGHFGLGERRKVDRVEVRWIGGGVDVFEDIAVDKFVTLEEGSGASK